MVLLAFVGGSKAVFFFIFAIFFSGRKLECPIYSQGRFQHEKQHVSSLTRHVFSKRRSETHFSF